MMISISKPPDMRPWRRWRDEIFNANGAAVQEGGKYQWEFTVRTYGLDCQLRDDVRHELYTSTPGGEFVGWLLNFPVVVYEDAPDALVRTGEVP